MFVPPWMTYTQTGCWLPSWLSTLMNFGTIDIWWSLLAHTLFGMLCLWTSEVFDFACLLAWLVSFFPLLCHFCDSHWLLTCFVFRLAFNLFGPHLVSSHCLCLWALAVNSLGGLIIIWMLGAYVDSCPGTLTSALWAHYGRWTSLSLSAL